MDQRTRLQRLVEVKFNGKQFPNPAMRSSASNSVMRISQNMKQFNLAIS